MSLLVVGSVAFDAVETPHGKIDRMLGGAATYFSIAASYFTHVNLVGIVGEDFTEKDASIFRGRRVNTLGLERAEGKTFFWAGRYSENMNERTTLATELNVFAEFKPRLPETYQSPEHVFLANIDPTLQRSVLHQVKRRPKVVALDTMNYWIERTPTELRETLRHTDILMINDSETRQLSNEHNLLVAARHIFKLGPKALVIKRGEYGAMLVHQNRVFSVPAFPLEKVHDPTGAGDTFAGGFMGYLASVRRLGDAELRRAMVYGSVMGSFTVEKFGLDRLRELKRSEIHARARHFSKMTQFTL
jgi:sugar/nucleoside kinase (ribokinase family)